MNGISWTFINGMNIINLDAHQKPTQYDRAFPQVKNLVRSSHSGIMVCECQVYECLTNTIDWLVNHYECRRHKFSMDLSFFKVQNVSLFLIIIPTNSKAFGLTLIPSNLDKALSGLRALSVLRDLMAPSSE